MSIGMLMAFYVVATNFLIPIGRFVQFADAFQILEGDLQRINDVLDAPEDRRWSNRTRPIRAGSPPFEDEPGWPGRLSCAT